MLLVTSGATPAGDGSWGSRAASFFLHGALIAAAVGATRHVAPTDVGTHRDTTIFWVPPAPHPATPSAPQPGSPHPSFQMPVMVPLVIPDPDPTPVATAPPGWSIGVDSAPVSRPGLPGTPGTGLPPVAPIDARLAEEPPVLVDHPAPNYPGLLRQAGLEGRVVVEVVLDTLGRAEPASLRISTSAHALFDAEASRVVLASRYRAARMGGRPVRVRILVPVSFGLRR